MVGVVTLRAVEPYPMLKDTLRNKNAPSIYLVQADIAVKVLAGVRHPRITVTCDTPNDPPNFARTVVRLEGIVTPELEQLA